MKYISLALLIIFLIVVVKSKEEVDSKQKELQETRKEINLLLEKHNDYLYLACFSVFEVRPFSILQFKQNVDIYTGKWISPIEYVSNINQKEKEILLSKIIEYLNNEEKVNKNIILNKLDFWCINHKQLNFIATHYNTPKFKLVEIFEKIEQFDEITNAISNQGPNTFDRNDEKQIEEALTNAENILSDLDLKQQLSTYSTIYRELSLVASK